MNLQVLKRSRKDPVPGDIFAYKLLDFDYGFGRVIRTDASMSPWEGLLLIYIYDAFSESLDDIPELDRRELILPPKLLLDKGPWTRGLFQTIEHRPLRKKDVLRTHCFRDDVFEQYVNEYGQPLKRKSNPCGIHAVGSHYTIDAQISIALGADPDPETLP